MTEQAQATPPLPPLRETLKRSKRKKVPTVLQMEAAECGAASLKMILDSNGRFVSLEELRLECGVSRDGSKASNVVKAARKYGMKAKGYSKDIDGLYDIPLPAILHWNFNHFLVLEGFGRNKAFINDPAVGRRRVTPQELDRAFTGVVLVIERGEEFEKGGERQNIIASLSRRFSNSGGALLYVVLAALGVVITGLVLPVFSQIFIDEILIRGQNWITPLLVGMGITAVIRGIMLWLQLTYLLRLETKLAVTLSSKFLWHILSLPVEFFHQRLAGEVAGRVALNDKIARLLSGELANTLLNLVLVVFYVLMMLRYDVTLTLIGVSLAILNFLVLSLISRRRVDVSMRLLQEKGKLIGTTMIGLWMMDTLKARGAETDFFARWSGYQAKSLNAEQEFGISSQIMQAVPSMISILTTMVILVLGSVRILNGDLSVGRLVAFQTLMSSFFQPVANFVRLGGTLQEVRGDMNRVDDLLRYDVDPNADLTTQPTEMKSDLIKLTGHLELRNISFGYSRRARPLIRDFNLTLKPGERVALVGSSGSGKSTIAKLVAGLYQPWDGEILFDGQSRSAYPPYVISKSMGIVDQDIIMFEGTIFDNLSLWDATINYADMITASKDALIHNDITSRTGGYDSSVIEGGGNFSGGQRQRLEIARALVTNPTLMILDEATSALDPITEQAIIHNLRLRGCTTLIIAHRLSTIRDSDDIVVMDRGKIVERGTHDELLKLNGAYRKLISSEEYESSDNLMSDILHSIGD